MNHWHLSFNRCFSLNNYAHFAEEKAYIPLHMSVRLSVTLCLINNSRMP